MSHAFSTVLTGYTHVYGDHIDTDRIIPGKYTKTLDLSQLSAHVLEDLDPEFRSRMRQGDFVVGGDNFGCGSSREQAPLALKHSGVGAVLARSFARIFYRNSINIGLPLIELPTLNHSFMIQAGDHLEVNLSQGTVHNLTTGVQAQARPLPPVMQAILEAGGLTKMIAANGGWGSLVNSTSVDR